MPDSAQLLANLMLLHPKLIDLSLGRIERLLARIGSPHLALPPVIHVAGTNGKGSVTAYLKAMFEAANRRVHVYTSPHLVRFHERIVLAGDHGPARPISEAALVDVLLRAEAANAHDDITQFEITTAAAFLAFAEKPADVLILEVGLGGRLDATNVVARPVVSVITPISIDHADKLGATLEKIATEKAGILKPRVKAVISQQDRVALDVLQAEARRLGAPLIVWGEQYQAYQQNGRLVVQTEDRVLDLPLPALAGRHQIVNAGTAVATALAFEGTPIAEAAIARGLVTVHWPARMQRLDQGPLPALLRPGSELWLDGGHNPAAGHVLAETLADFEERAPKPLHLVVGMMGLKDVGGFLAPFRGLARSVTAVPIPGALETPFTPEALAAVARQTGFAAAPVAGVAAALARIENLDDGAKRILICGSLYLAGHVLAMQEGVKPQAN